MPRVLSREEEHGEEEVLGVGHSPAGGTTRAPSPAAAEVRKRGYRAVITWATGPMQSALATYRTR